MRQWISENKLNIWRWLTPTLLPLIFIALIAFGINKRSSIQAGDVMQILILLALVVVTGAYAWSASRQADASVKMAKEMREQRYDAVRPVIDIERRSGGDELIGEGLAAQKEEFSYGVWCILRNIGVGPAIDVHSFIVNLIDGKCQLWPFGTLAAEDYTEKMKFYPQQRGDRWVLVAYYKDVHGRCFESSREVSKDTERGGWKTGPLDPIEIAKEEFPK